MKDKYKDTIIDTLTDILHSIELMISDNESADWSDEDLQWKEGYLKALEDIKDVVVNQLHDITG